MKCEGQNYDIDTFKLDDTFLCYLSCHISMIDYLHNFINLCTITSQEALRVNHSKFNVSLILFVNLAVLKGYYTLVDIHVGF